MVEGGMKCVRFLLFAFNILFVVRYFLYFCLSCHFKITNVQFCLLQYAVLFTKPSISKNPMQS